MRVAEPLRARTADHPLPRPVQVVIWAIPTPTRASKYLLAQFLVLSRMVPLIFAVNVIVKFACDRTVLWHAF